MDDHGVPCEISDPDFALGVFDDPELRARGWVTSYEHAAVGRLDQFGLLVDLSDTPGRIAGPPLSVGADSREVLAELGLSAAEVDALLADGVVAEAQPA